MRSVQQIVEDMREHMKDGVVQVKEAHERGVPVVGGYCTYMPWELVWASGAIPVSLCSKNNSAIPAAEEHLPRNLCPLIKASYGHAITGSCPYFHFCDLVVGETTCDGKKKMYELLEHLKPIYMIQLPQRPDRPEDLALMTDEFLKFRRRLEELVGHEITDEEIRQAIVLRNRERMALKKLWGLAQGDNPVLNGLETQQFTEYMQYHFDKEEAISWLEAQIEELQVAWNSGDRRHHTGPRVLVTGCPISGAMKVVEAIEGSGGTVVCYENCGGEKELGYLVDEEGDVIDALARKYLAIGCSVMSPNDSRFITLRHLVEQYRVDGVVDMTLTSCHTYAIETWSVRRLVQSMGRAYLAVETDYSESDCEQLATRLGAFVEML